MRKNTTTASATTSSGRTGSWTSRRDERSVEAGKWVVAREEPKLIREHREIGNANANTVRSRYGRRRRRVSTPIDGKAMVASSHRCFMTVVRTDDTRIGHGRFDCFPARTERSRDQSSATRDHGLSGAETVAEAAADPPAQWALEPSPPLRGPCREARGAARAAGRRRDRPRASARADDARRRGTGARDEGSAAERYRSKRGDVDRIDRPPHRRADRLRRRSRNRCGRRCDHGEGRRRRDPGRVGRGRSVRPPPPPWWRWHPMSISPNVRRRASPAPNWTHHVASGRIDLAALRVP